MNPDLIMSLIPARSGSRGVANKNVKLLKGYPLIAYSIIASKLSNKIGRIIVTTDSKDIANIAKKFGAEVPFLRPKKISHGSSLDIEFVKHCLMWLKTHRETTPKYIIHLRPTTPLRAPEVIDYAIESIINTKEATSLRSIHLVKETPFKCFSVKEGFLEPIISKKELLKDKSIEFYNLPRQFFPIIYRPNGYVDIIKSEVVLKKDLLHGNKILSFETTDIGELDTIEDFNYIEWKLNKEGSEVYDYLCKYFKPEIY